MGFKTREFDAANYIETKEDAACYLDAVFSEGDKEMILIALGEIARSKGMTQISRETGITRDGLYKALTAEGNPSFETVLRVVNSLGFRLSVTLAE